ncbi:MAG TPA: helix-hairpin-helix domain-containing protein, partial [Anaerovoracaceae bacterium]|nr:helix-hairpin-helix domain-containing protein [Anaerovoracaceae bacterium]
ISENLTRSGTVIIPDHCPVCEGDTAIKQENGVKALYCPNDECQAKHVKSFTHFVSRDAMGIDGLSEATVEKLIDRGLVKEYADIFRVVRFKDEITTMEGFGDKSFQNLIDSVNKARKTNPVRLLFSLGIPNVGLSNAKNICRNFNYQWSDIQNAAFDQLIQINGIGDVMANAYVKFFGDEKNQLIVEDLLREIEFEEQPAAGTASELIFDGLTFVITGSVEHFKNRNDLKETIEAMGGKTTDSVTSKTDYLINNDNLSGSTKNKKAKELGVGIITEEQLLDWIDNDVKPEI